MSCLSPEACCTTCTEMPLCLPNCLSFFPRRVSDREEEIGGTGVCCAKVCGFEAPALHFADTDPPLLSFPLFPHCFPRYRSEQTSALPEQLSVLKRISSQSHPRAHMDAFRCFLKHLLKLVYLGGNAPQVFPLPLSLSHSLLAPFPQLFWGSRQTMTLLVRTS